MRGLAHFDKGDSISRIDICGSRFTKEPFMLLGTVMWCSFLKNLCSYFKERWQYPKQNNQNCIKFTNSSASPLTIASFPTFPIHFMPMCVKSKKIGTATLKRFQVIQIADSDKSDASGSCSSVSLPSLSHLSNLTISEPSWCCCSCCCFLACSCPTTPPSCRFEFAIHKIYLNWSWSIEVEVPSGNFKLHFLAYSDTGFSDTV